MNLPRFNEGDGLSAEAMNRIVDAIIQRITGGPGILVGQSGGNVTVSASKQVLRQRGFFYAWPTEEVSAGEYKFEQIQRNAANDGWEARPNGISTNGTGRNLFMANGETGLAPSSGTVRLPIQVRLVDRNGNEPVYVGSLIDTMFPAIITGHGSDLGNNFWPYAWSEAKFSTGTTIAAVSGGRSGTTSSGYAINILEMNHTSQYAFGMDMNGSDYPAGGLPMPVGAAGSTQTHKYNVPVDMHVSVADDGSIVYWFAKFWSHDGTCT